LAADLELALEVGRVRGDVERRAVLAVATSRLGVACDDAARGRIKAAAMAVPNVLDPAVSRAAQALEAMEGAGEARRFQPTFPRRRRASAQPAAQEGAGAEEGVAGVADQVPAVEEGETLPAGAAEGAGVDGVAGAVGG
jgi:hypothetical protein